MSSSWWLLALVIVLLALSAFFVAAEFSLISARRSAIEPLAATSARARSTLHAMEDVSVMMACAQLGITLCGVLLGALGEPAVARLLEPVAHAAGLPEAAVHPVALTIALLLVVGAHVALGEMVPKNIALAGPERTAMLLAPPLRALATFLGPVVRGLNAMANGVVRLFGHEPKDEVASAYGRDEVAGLVAQSRAEGLLDVGEHDRLTSALEFDTRTVDPLVLTPAEVVSVPVGVSAAAVEVACARTGFSRFPVRRPDGGYRGYLHIRDVLTVAEQDRDSSVPAGLIRPLPAVPAGADLRQALEEMRRQSAHLAKVVSGDGETVGVIALEDVIEELVGEIADATRRRPPSHG